MSENLQDQIIRRYGEDPLKKLEIPSYIKDNLSKELRFYQIEALRLYLANNETFKRGHLMFNMATGSGKTLVMAALMLECYKRGYRNFVFFVNSTAIVEKTKANFCDKASSKYLFVDSINIDGECVEIRSVESFNESNDNAINIYFGTIQGLFDLFTKEKEDSITLDDLKNHKIVFLADEAHHLNADTKKKDKNAIKDKEGWEGIMNKAFASHSENLMLEFTATIPKDKSVAHKYRDKILYEYNLKSFCKDGFSKRIFLVKYDDVNLKTRFLGACLLSVYREWLAMDRGIFLKPVVLFKSENIKVSQANQAAFNAMLESLNGEMIEEFYSHIDLGNELFLQSLEFFRCECGNDFANLVARQIRESFKPLFQLNANDEEKTKTNQIKLNTLEDKDNEIRAIFAVDKLNEGWDVLNLFDIVRLSDSRVGKKHTTTKEAQLIGRGARYFPFGNKESRYIRKYDSIDCNDELSMLERLSYHSLNEVEYINNLRGELGEQGLLFDEQRQEVVLEPSKRARDITKEHEIYYLKNERIITDEETTLSALFEGEIREKLQRLDIPYFAKYILEQEEDFKEEQEKEIKTLHRAYDFGEKISYQVVAKAMNILEIGMDSIQKAYPECGSKRDFYNDFLAKLKLVFNKRQSFEPINQLEIAKFVLENLKNLLFVRKQIVSVTDFKPYLLTNTGERNIFVNKDKLKNSQYEWLYYTQYCADSELEEGFLRFIDSQSEKISAVFEEWIILRNDGFSEFKLFDNREGKPTYGDGFEPDFIFFGKPKGATEKSLAIECIMESKGEHLKERDKWKEELLVHVVNGMRFDRIINSTSGTTYKKADFKVVALPFFFGRGSSREFEGAFERFLEGAGGSLFDELVK